MPTHQGASAYRHTSWFFRYTGCSLRPCPSRPRWTSTFVPGICVSLNLYRSLTRWPEAIPIPDITAITVAQAFVSNWIARFGVPSTITTDCGAQVESDLWQQVMRFLGTHRIRTTAHHPAANGLVKRFHRQLKAALSTAPRTQWIEALPLVLLGIRSSLKEDLHASTSELVYGTTLHLPGRFFCAIPRQGGY